MKFRLRDLSALILVCLAASGPGLRAQEQHTAEPPQILEGPQTPGVMTHPKPAAVMTNDSVLRMHRAGLADDLVLQTINAQPGRYNTTADDLIELKQAGLSDPILAAMANKARRQITNAERPQVEVAEVNEIGVYYKDKNGRWQPMESEVVHIKSGGFLKSTATHGIIKEDHNGVVTGREAKLLLPRPIEFLIYTPDGVEGGEYDLIRFRLNSKDREFRVLTVGSFIRPAGRSGTRYRSR